MFEPVTASYMVNHFIKGDLFDDKQIQDSDNDKDNIQMINQ